MINTQDIFRQMDVYYKIMVNAVVPCMIRTKGLHLFTFGLFHVKWPNFRKLLQTNMQEV